MKPTESQIGTLFKWFHWNMTNDKATKAMDWLEKNANRKEVSAEISRVWALYHSRRLTEEECFNSPIWKGFDYKEGKDAI